MSRLPTPGGDNGNWGNILNDYLLQAHKSDGTLKDDSVNAANITDGSISEALLDSGVQAKLNQTAPVTSVNTKTGAVTLAKGDIGLGNVDNTSDANKPISTATQSALDSKASRRRARAALTEGKIKGGNITVKPNGGSWGGLWSEWDWDNWIKPQVDRAVVLGLNTVRIIGAPQVVFNASTSPSQISQATYDSRWKQLAQYCLDQGLRLYPALTEKWAFMGYTGAPNNFQDATVTAGITTTAAVLAQYENVIGFDIFQEGTGVADGLVLADVLALYAAIRAVAPGIPLTTSNSSGGFGTAAGFWADTSSLSYQAWTATGGADFVDIHVYLEGVNAADLDGFVERTSMPILIGEYGADQSLSSSSQVARYTSARVLHNRAGVLGSLVWALADQGTSTTNQAGVWDNTGFTQGTWPTDPSTAPLSTTSGQRTNLVNELHWFANAFTPIVSQTAQPNILPARTSRPVNSTSGWAAGANTYLWTDPKGLGVGATAAGNIVAGSSGTLSPASPSTPYRADIEILTQVAGRTVTMAMNSYNSSGTYLTTSTAVSITSGANTVTPAKLSGVFTSHSSAAYVALVITMTGATSANEWMLILASPRPRLAAI
jgi:hypothetical protein